MSMYWGDFTCFTATTHFVANYVEFCKKRNFMGSSRFITVLHTWGGQDNLLQYYMGAGGSAQFIIILQGRGVVGSSNETNLQPQKRSPATPTGIQINLTMQGRRTVQLFFRKIPQNGTTCHAM